MKSRDLLYHILVIVLIINVIFVYLPFAPLEMESVFDCEPGSDDYKLMKTGQYYMKYTEFPITYSIASNVTEWVVNEIHESISVWEELVNFNLFEFNNTEYNLKFHYIDLNLFRNIDGYYGNANYISNATIINDEYIKLNQTEIKINNQIDWYTSDYEIECKLNNNKVIIKAIILHEIGHILGLDHTKNTSNTMYEYYYGTHQVTLSPGDKLGFCKLYDCRS